MNTEDLFAMGCVTSDLHAVSKKQLFQEMAELAIQCGAIGADTIKSRDIVSAVSERERLGSTGVGYGVAIPHARLEGLSKVRAIFARLETPLDYESIDERPVDLVVLLLAPANASGDHLKALAQVSRLLRREDIRDKLRTAPNIEALHVLLTEDRKANAA
ncbi:MAG: PTS sugar transporter subunit IIA [Robiginitomaculum sp.]|nr:PTS sugar transporter subunit IIA [Robiginitomaculum sp.]